MVTTSRFSLSGFSVCSRPVFVLRHGLIATVVLDVIRLYPHGASYAHSPEQNPDGYGKAAISNVTALCRVGRFFLAHGTADDNVHIGHTLALVDQLDQANLTNYDFVAFPYADHDIKLQNDRKMLYSSMRL
ncbi:Putative peptidase S9, prolyl oligopeptidase, catalytic domain, alpha/Beta hydrolase [Colletotrichum destructivum]|uniref:Peptidase S9, prolyl oligopeptidase, catalytic domain, alpha/Beta hydrolase n=1 Tax=Colletotrichum destructivum TaxID=34406 RepID=A0AAX4J456_9PEZI|nr:Putative peptidase S9, prolyl oligopeptidase, catalytic domain, alpha/Beta hydrolase [Colletotrichum destructivum]